METRFCNVQASFLTHLSKPHELPLCRFIYLSSSASRLCRDSSNKGAIKIKWIIGAVKYLSFPLPDRLSLPFPSGVFRSKIVQRAWTWASMEKAVATVCWGKGDFYWWLAGSCLQKPQKTKRDTLGTHIRERAEACSDLHQHLSGNWKKKNTSDYVLSLFHHLFCHHSVYPLCPWFVLRLSPSTHTSEKLIALQGRNVCVRASWPVCVCVWEGEGESEGRLIVPRVECTQEFQMHNKVLCLSTASGASRIQQERRGRGVSHSRFTLLPGPWKTCRDQPPLRFHSPVREGISTAVEETTWSKVSGLGQELGSVPTSTQGLRWAPAT